MRIRGMFVALVLIGLTLFAGCSGDEPVPRMPKTSAAAPTTAPSSSAPPLTEAQEAEALIRRWAELDLEMQNTGETAAYLAITSDKCVSCRRAVDSIKKLYSAGGTIELPGKRVVSVRESPRFELGQHTYEARTLVDPSRYRTSPEAAWKTFDGGKDIADFTLVRENGELRIGEIVSTS